MSDNDKDATVTETETNETVETEELDLSVDSSTEADDLPKVRQQIQQELGNRDRATNERFDKLEELIANSSKKPLEAGESPDDDDYLTGAQARKIVQDSNADMKKRVDDLQASNQQLEHRSTFQSNFPGVSYKETTEAAFALAREDNPGVEDQHLGSIASSYMNRIARGKNKKVSTETAPAPQTKKAPDSAEGASASSNASVSPEAPGEFKELTPAQVKKKYDF